MGKYGSKRIGGPGSPVVPHHSETIHPETFGKIDCILCKGDAGADARRFTTQEFRWTCTPKIRRDGMPAFGMQPLGYCAPPARCIRPSVKQKYQRTFFGPPSS